jgi:DtxR family Mn-dependent transcriptional regulator
MVGDWMRKKTVEEYIEVICSLEREEGEARPGRMAARMGLKPPSITEMLRKLEEEGLVIYRSYSGVHLTPAGLAIARNLTRRHEILAEFLISIGVTRNRAEKDACQIEHHISEESVERIEEFVRRSHNHSN